MWTSLTEFVVQMHWPHGTTARGGAQTNIEELGVIPSIPSSCDFAPRITTAPWTTIAPLRPQTGSTGSRHRRRPQLSLSFMGWGAFCSSRYPRWQPVGAYEGGGHSWLNRGKRWARGMGTRSVINARVDLRRLLRSRWSQLRGRG
jgi:hypothetical protein